MPGEYLGVPASRRIASGALAAALVALTGSPAQAAARPGTTIRVSVSPGGIGGSGGSANPAISADGRFVTFTSSAPELVPDDTNNVSDVFLLDRESGVIERVSLNPDGTQAKGTFSEPSISGDGRFVTFLAGSRLTAEDTNNSLDVYLLDRQSGELEVASVVNGAAVGGTQGDVSDDGRYVSFAHFGALVASDSNEAYDIYVRDRVAGEVELASANDAGVAGNGEAYWHDLSGDGRSVAFDSNSSDLVPGDANTAWDVFVRDLEANRTVRASVSSSGIEGNADSFTGYATILSRDGKTVAFLSYSSNLVPADGHYFPDIFVRDLRTGTTERVSVASDGTEPDAYSMWPALSASGRYVGFMSYATNLSPEDANGRQSPQVVFGRQDYFLHDRLTGSTELVSIGDSGMQAQAGFINVVSGVSSDGRFVAFALEDELDATDSNSVYDVFVRDRGPELGVARVSAAITDETVTVEGWVTFSGGPVISVEDAPGDARLPGGGSAEKVGGDLRGFDAVYRPERGDLLLRWRPSELPGVQPPGGCCGGTFTGPGLLPGLAGVPGVTYGWEATVAGVRYEVRAGRAGAGAPAGAPFAAVYRCVTICEEVARLSSSFGGTGVEVRTSVPLSALGLGAGQELAASRVFSAVADPGAGGGLLLDEIAAPGAPIPDATVSVAFAPEGETPSAWSSAPLGGGRFSAEIPASGHGRVWARACLGAECTITARSVS